MFWKIHNLDWWVEKSGMLDQPHKHPMSAYFREGLLVTRVPSKTLKD